MTLPVFFSDLDKTLIYSNTAIKQYHNSSAGTLVMEEYKDKPLSFMTLNTWKTLVEHAGKSFMFVPTTTRTPEQFHRIQFADVELDTAIVLNGAKILVNGREDYDWTKSIAAGIDNSAWHPLEVWERVKKDLDGVADILNIRNADDFFVYIVTEKAKHSSVEAYTKQLAQETGYIRSHQGRKTYLMPECVSKGKAVAELTKRLDASLTFAAGDSELDIAMSPHVTHYIQPAHWDGVTSHYLQTEHKGIRASDDIMRLILERL